MRTALLILLLSTAVAAQAQDAGRARRTVYFELLGNGGVASINYEQEWRPQTLWRAGLAVWSTEDLWSENEISVVGMPLMVTRLTGPGNHHFEYGAGVFLGHRDETLGTSGGFASLTGVAGYRFQRPQGGFVFRAGFTPFLSITGGDNAYPDSGFTPSFGISFGGAF